MAAAGIGVRSVSPWMKPRRVLPSAAYTTEVAPWSTGLSSAMSGAEPATLHDPADAAADREHHQRGGDAEQHDDRAAGAGAGTTAAELSGATGHLVGGLLAGLRRSCRNTEAPAREDGILEPRDRS